MLNWVMVIKKILEEIVQYFSATRQVGHTTTMLHGTIDNTEPVVIVTHNHEHGRYIQNLTKKSDITTSIYAITNGTLRGRKSPIVFDNAALHIILSESLEKINLLEDVVLERNNQLKKQQEEFSVFIESIIGLCEEKFKHHIHTRDIRQKYAEEYSYKVVVRDRLEAPSDKNVKEAMWHDGSRDGHSSASYSIHDIITKLKSFKVDDNFDKQK
jgi:hypothetical protein